MKTYIKVIKDYFLEHKLSCISLFVGLIGIIAAIVICANTQEKTVDNQIVAETIDIPQQRGGVVIEQEEPEKTYEEIPTAIMFAAVGYEDMIVYPGDDSKFFNNPENHFENMDICVEYTFSENGEVFATSGILVPSETYFIDFSEYLSEGSHEVTIIQKPLILINGEYESQFSSKQTITVTVEG